MEIEVDLWSKIMYELSSLANIKDFKGNFQIMEPISDYAKNCETNRVKCTAVWRKHCSQQVSQLINKKLPKNWVK